MELGLFQKQTMNLVMTTELRQAIALLQYSSLELSQFVQEQAMDNPLIELDEQSSEFVVESRLERGYNDGKTSSLYSEPFDPIAYIPNKTRNWYEDLLEQIKYLPTTKEERKIMKYIILNLDDNGYISMKDEEIAAQLSISIEKVKKGIRELQQLEPVGLGARNLKECLYIQAIHYYPDNPMVAHIIQEHLELVADKKWQALTKQLNISMEELRDVTSCITSLHPRPCSTMVDSETYMLYPDVTIEKVNGEYTITIHDQFIPKLRLNETYLNLKQIPSETGSYIRDNYQKYKWLMKSIEQRKTTIMHITKAVIEKQQLFLDKGFSHLEPMTLKEIADQIGMHESTISRATSNKVIRTPHGSFEMRKLFTAKIGGNNGSHASSTQVKLQLKQLIQQEDTKKPLSDQKLADHFRRENGITISRRTIAKYREELNILASSKRKTIG